VRAKTTVQLSNFSGTVTEPSTQQVSLQINNHTYFFRERRSPDRGDSIDLTTSDRVHHGMALASPSFAVPLRQVPSTATTMTGLDGWNLRPRKTIGPLRLPWSPSPF